MLCFHLLSNNALSFAAIDSKTSSRARDRKGVYTQNSKMAAQNGRMTTNFKPLFLGNWRSQSRYFVYNNITIHELHNKRKKQEKNFLDLKPIVPVGKKTSKIRMSQELPHQNSYRLSYFPPPK